MTRRVLSLIVGLEFPPLANAAACRQGRPHAWWASVRGHLARDQFGLFVLAAAGMLVASPRVPVLGYYYVAQLLGQEATRPDLDGWPHVPGVFFVAVALALATFSFRPELRLKLLAWAVAPLAILYGRLDVRSILPLTLFVLVAFAVVRLPVSRLRAGLLAIGLSLATLAAFDRFVPGSAAVRFAAGWATLVPMLWYAVYEHERHRLSLGRFVGYLSGRLFSSPVYKVTDLFSITSRQQLVETRWAGVRTIYGALLAAAVVAGAERITILAPPDGHTGAALLALSYVQYIGAYCEIVVRFNLVIGVLRLFGIPIRPNFRNWLLARTPNEHWQRWNVLFREWILTFVFFPIMRSRRWLFAAVMAALLASGLLHIAPLSVMQGLPAPRLVAHSLFWVLNGLAIYAVLRIPQMAPRTIERLRLRKRRVWSVVGIVLTSSFYAILHGFRTESASWTELRGYGRRLMDLGVLEGAWGVL